MFKQQYKKQNNHQFADCDEQRKSKQYGSRKNRSISNSAAMSPMSSQSSFPFNSSFSLKNYKHPQRKQENSRHSHHCSKSSSHRSSSRQKILEHKIDIMLKEQEGKIKECSKKANINKIKFVNCKIIMNKQDRNCNSKIVQQTLKSQLEQDKENNRRQNNKIQFQPNCTQKSNIVSLRNYLNNTCSISQKPNNESQILLTLSGINKNKENSQNVLKQVRQLKQMILEMVKTNSQTKTKRKQKLFCRKQDQLFSENYTLP